MKKEYNWATLGTGVIANELAQALAKQGRKIYSVANRTHEKGVKFAEKYGIEKVYDTIDEVFEDENVDIIYISTPHNTHINFLRKALKAGKHVLCEKSITLNSEELEEANQLAKENHVVFAEAMTIFHMPLYKEINQFIKNNELGNPSLLTLNFGSFKEYDMNNRFFNRNLAGGALLDIGVYALSFARWFMSEKPEEVLSQVKLAPTGVDEKVGLLLKNSKDEMATIMLSMHTKQPKRGIVAYEKGYLEVMEYPRSANASFTFTDNGKRVEIASGKRENALLYEVQDMEKTISKEEDCMYQEYTKDVMDIMTKLRKEWGLVYPEEE
ncbi:MAG: Gfo/Idh/MocA family oxidoreductase [Firmicutes bacterium]|nr:Gfo/Idh/MocA family oxidoreductase [Bacillota bacterium]